MVPFPLSLRRLLFIALIIRDATAEKLWNSRVEVIRQNPPTTCENITLQFYAIGNGSVSCVSHKPILMDLNFHNDNKEILFTVSSEHKFCNLSNQGETNQTTKMFESILRMSPSLLNDGHYTKVFHPFEVTCKNTQQMVGMKIELTPHENGYGMNYTRKKHEQKPAFDAWPSNKRDVRTMSLQNCAQITLAWNPSRSNFTCNNDNEITAAQFLPCNDLQNCRSHAKSALLSGKCQGDYKQHECNDVHRNCQLENVGNVKSSGILYCKENDSVVRVPIFKYTETFQKRFNSFWDSFKDDDNVLRKFVKLEFNSTGLTPMTFICFVPKFLAIQGFTWTIVRENTSYSICETSTSVKTYQDKNYLNEVCTYPRPTVCKHYYCSFQISCSVYFQNGKEYNATLNHCSHFTQNCSANSFRSQSRTTHGSTTTQIYSTSSESPPEQTNFPIMYPSTAYDNVTSTVHDAGKAFTTDSATTNHADVTQMSTTALPLKTENNKTYKSTISTTLSTANIPNVPNSSTAKLTDQDIDKVSQQKNIFYILAGGMATVIVILIVLFIFYYRKSNKRKVQLVSSEEIRNFLEGTVQISNLNHAKDQGAMIVRYDMRLEIPRGNVKLDTKVLGKGNFGKVILGSVGSKSVAVKMLDKSVHENYFRAILSELKIMSYVGKHENIVELVGANTEQIRHRDVYVILEFCSNGNALDYVRARRDIFLDLISESAVTSIIPEDTIEYENFVSKRLSSIDLIRWSMEIAAGMDFIASKHVCHGDLAARNILLSNRLVVKIGDFGLAKQLTDYSLYVQKEECPLPLKWMSIESLRDLEFSIQSDVWSFGITAWELFSLGCTPYPGIHWNFQSWKSLLDGQRMECAQYSSHGIHNVLLKCWETRPNDRPKFADLQQMFAAELQKVTLNCSPLSPSHTKTSGTNNI